MLENRLRNIILESVREVLNEAFKSNRLRDWAKRHGGIKKTFADEGYPNSNVRQDLLGEISDNDITYFEEFPSIRDAEERKYELNTIQTPYGRRSHYDMKSFYTIYWANDGACVVVGIDRDNFDTGIEYGGGEVSKKAVDRTMRDVQSPFPYWKTNRYTDDRDTYYYSQKGQDFGLRTNDNYKGKMKDNQNIYR